MAQVNAGRVRFVSRGEYNNSTQYYLFDLVDYNGSSYFAKANTTGNVPTNTTYWQLVAEKGNTGGDGPVGPTGNGIASIVKTASAGLIDTYTITFTDGSTTTFNITNGQDGDVTQEYVDEENERLKSVFNVLPKVSDSGESVTLENTGDTMLYKMDLKGNTSQEVIQGEVGLEEEDTSIYVDDVNEDKENYITLKGNTYQETTSISGGDQYDSPSPDYPQEIEVVTGLNEVKVEGKNLLPTQVDKWEQGGISSSTGSVITSQARLRTKDYYPIKNDTDYYVSVQNTNYCYLNILLYDNNKEYLKDYHSIAYGFNGATSKKINISSTDVPNVSYMKVVLKNSDDVSTITPSEIEIAKPMIEKGSTATTYTPYVSQTYEIDLRTSKNLFDISTITRGYELNSNTGGIQVNANWWVSDYIGIKPNTDYTSSNISSLTKCWYDSNKNFISRVQTTTGTSPSNARYLRVNGTLASIESNPNLMIEEGNTATTYQAYSSIELCKIGTYQDRIYKSLVDGDWYLHKEIYKEILDGTQNWTYQSQFPRFISDLSNIPVNAATSYCSHYFQGQTANVNNSFGVVSGTGYKRVLIHDERFTTKEGYNAWLSINNVTLYYPLATPTDTQITDTTLVNQLNALYNATIYSTTHINTETSNLLPYINLKYNVVTASPSPEKASEVKVVTGNNTITISNEDGTKTQTYNITLGNLELCKIGDYQDRIYKDSGKWYLNKQIGKVVLNGSENWSAFASVNYEYQLSLFAGLSTDTSNQYFPALCNKYINHNVAGSSLSNYEFSHFSTQPSTVKERFVRFRNNDITTLANWKTELQTNNAILYVPLATPTTTEITDQLLVSQLDELQKAMSYYDKTIITQTNADKPFILDVIGIRDLQDIFNLISGE